MNSRIPHILSFSAFIATIFLANWAVLTFGIIPIGFGLKAPAGVLFVGASFLLRDWLQHTGGYRSVFGAISIGTLLSALLSPHLAVASASAFLVSELIDFGVYTITKRRYPTKQWIAVIFSNVCGSIIDSALFLLIAFGSLTFFPGQVIGKLWITLVFLIVIRSKMLDRIRAERAAHSKNGRNHRRK